MNDDHAEIREILEDLIQGIDQVKRNWKLIADANPHFEQVSNSHWIDKEARMWLHGATDVSEAIELEKWRSFPTTPTQPQTIEAIIFYERWSDYTRENGVYVDFTPPDLGLPDTGETLKDFISRLASLVESNRPMSKRNKRAINSFLAFLRNPRALEEMGVKTEDTAFIELIVPQKRDLRDGHIIRKIPPQVLGISIQVASAVVRELALQSAYGRANARHNATETLALIWLCLTASRIRHPRSLESVHSISTKAIIVDEAPPQLLVPSVFGVQQIRVSDRMARYLCAVSKIPSTHPRSTILQTPLPDLRKPLATAIKKVNPPARLGEITFLTFLSPPHHFGKDIR